jgi:hypothetical protein
MILYAKFGQHQPLNRQSQIYAREGIELDVSTLADWVGACSATLAPLHELIRRHVLSARRLHGDDTPVPVLAKSKTVTGRLWTYVRDDRPFGGQDPPAALFFYSRDRGGDHPRRHLAGWAGILQADAYAGFGELYDEGRHPGPVSEAACWAHGRRKFFTLADLKQPPLASEAVQRIDAIFAIEREIAGPASPASSRTEGSVLPTMPPNGRYAPSPSAARLGCSPARTGVASARRRCSRSSRQPSSMTSIPRPGLPTCSAGSMIIRYRGSRSCCPGTGGP